LFFVYVCFSNNNNKKKTTNFSFSVYSNITWHSTPLSGLIYTNQLVGTNGTDELRVCDLPSMSLTDEIFTTDFTLTVAAGGTSKKEKKRKVKKKNRK